MNCKNCGANIPENETKCPNCGTENTEETEYISAAGAERAIPKGFSAKKNIIVIIIIAVALLIGGIVTAVTVSNSAAGNISASETLQLAERYLSEQNYEQAVIEFRKVLEIEPMNVEAYLGLAEAYLSLGETDKAIEALKEGIELIGDDRLRSRLEEIRGEQETVVSESLVTEPPVTEPVYGSMGSVTIMGKEFDIATTSTLRIVSMSKFTEENGDHYYYQISPSLKYGYSIDIFNDWEIQSDISITDSDLKDISKLENLTYLKIMFCDITNVKFLAGLTNLTSLSLEDNQITDLTPLAGLTNLEYLKLWDNQITDLTPLAGLTNLEYLDLDYNQITDITPLVRLADLESLELAVNRIIDITPLAGLTNLESLELGDNQITDITTLAGLTNLEYLDLRNNPIPEQDIELLKSNLPNCNIG